VVVKGEREYNQREKSRCQEEVEVFRCREEEDYEWEGESLTDDAKGRGHGGEIRCQGKSRLRAKKRAGGKKRSHKLEQGREKEGGKSKDWNPERIKLKNERKKR